jgi:HD-GYP domain-containing protein (c-di-GMP phosphodiesterase class II)
MRAGKRGNMGYEDLKLSIDDVITMLIVTLDVRDPYACSHSERVAALSVLISSEMKLPVGEIERIHAAAHLHDIGKIGIPGPVLNKQDKLSRDELAQMQSHSRIGHDILCKMGLFKDVAPIVLYHHERYDGMGYPDNLRGEAIPLGSRIIAVADSFDAITSDRTYRPGSSLHYGFHEINRHVLDQFCPDVIAHFNRVRDEIGPLLDTIERVDIRHTAFVGHENLIHSKRVQ